MISITNLDELEAHAETNFPEVFHTLPPTRSYTVETDHGETIIGFIVGYTATYTDDHLHFQNAAVFAYIASSSGELQFLVEGATKDQKFYGSIRLQEPFIWLRSEFSPNDHISYLDSVSSLNGISCLDTLLRYYLMANGHDGHLDKAPAQIETSFHMACQHIALGQNTKKATLGICDTKEQEGRNSEKADAEMHVYEDRLERLITDFNAFKTGLDADHADCQAEKEDLKTKVEQLEEDLKEAQYEVESWKTKYETLKNDIRGVLQ